MLSLQKAGVSAGVSRCRAQALGSGASVVAEGGLRGWAAWFSYPMPCGIFSDQGLNWCLLPWQADSYPWYQPGKSIYIVFLQSHSCRNGNEMSGGQEKGQSWGWETAEAMEEEREGSLRGWRRSASWLDRCQQAGCAVILKMLSWGTWKRG